MKLLIKINLRESSIAQYSCPVCKFSTIHLKQRFFLQLIQYNLNFYIKTLFISYAYHNIQIFTHSLNLNLFWIKPEQYN